MKTLREMTAEIREYNTAKGWRDDPNTWGELMALLHTEIAEMTGAYRKWRLDDPTDPVGTMGKPEGVGSELADTFIRFLDMYDAHGLEPMDDDWETITLAEVAPLDWRNTTAPDYEDADALASDDSFGNWVTWLHGMAGLLYDNPTWNAPKFLRALVTFAERWGFDLATEYERKLKFNWTREFQHGGTL